MPIGIKKTPKEVSKFNELLGDFVEFQPEEEKPKTQAQRLIKKFGGVRDLYRALIDVGVEISPQAIYKWNWPQKRGGRAGLVPTQNWPDIFRAAKRAGLIITQEDMDPRLIIEETESQKRNRLMNGRS